MKPNKLFIFPVFLLLVISLNAQDHVFKFARTGSSSNPNWTESDSLGNNFIIGMFNRTFEYQGVVVTGNDSGESASNIFIVKTTPSGKPEWVRAIRGASTNDYLNPVKSSINNNGELVLVINTQNSSGIYIGDRLVPLESLNSYQLVVKFSKNGFVNWIKPIEATGSKGGVYIEDIKIDDGGTIYLAGNFTGSSLITGEADIPGLENYTRMFVSKLSNDGEIAWTSSCNVTASVIDTIGGITATRLEVFSNGSVAVAGTYEGNREFEIAGQLFRSQGNNNTYLACYNSAGAPLWANFYTGNGFIFPNDIVINENGDIVFTCFFQSGNMLVNGQTYDSQGDYDIIISKYGVAGNSVWDNVLNINIISVIDGFFQAKAGFTPEGNVSIVGEYLSLGIKHYYFGSYESVSGTLSWILLTENSGSIFFDDAKFDNNGNIYFCGSTFTDFLLDGISITDLQIYGAAFFGKVTNNGSAEYIYHRNNDIINTLSFRWINTDIFGSINILGSFYGDNVSLEDFLLSENSDNGFYLTRYSPVVNLAGKVFNFQGGTINSGYVKLIGYSNFHRSPIIDSVQINEDGSFLISDAPYGRYLLQVLPDSDGENTYFPTYFPSAFHWADAEQIEIKSPINLNSLFFFVPQKPVLSGHSKLSGLVSEVDEDDLFKSTMGKASPKAKAKLAKSKTKSDWEIIAETETDNEGNFNFENVDDGDYYVLIDIAGLPVIDPYNVIVAGGMFVSNLDYLIEEEEITCNGEPIYTFVEISDGNGSIKVYPNPAKGILNIDLEENTSIKEISLTDIHGRKIREFYNVHDNINLAGVEAGIYFLIVNTNSGRQAIKLIVNP